MIKFEFEFYDGYMSYNSKKGGFDSVEYHAISARMHRPLPASRNMKIDERFLPVYLYERYFCKRKYGRFGNVRVRYYKVDETGDISTFKTSRSFIKALESDLDKYRVYNPCTKIMYNFSDYDGMSVLLFPKFYSDEKLEINKFIRDLLEGRIENDTIKELIKPLERIRRSIYDLEAIEKYRLNKLGIPILMVYITDLQRQKILEEIKRCNIFSVIQDIFIVSDYVGLTIDDELKYSLRKHAELLYSLHKDIHEMESELNGMTKDELRESYYGILKDMKLLSATKQKIVETLLAVMNKDYAMKKELYNRVLSTLLSDIERILPILREKLIIKLREKEKEIEGLRKRLLRAKLIYNNLYTRRYRILMNKLKKSIIQV